MKRRFTVKPVTASSSNPSENSSYYTFYFGNDKRHLFKRLFNDMRGRIFRVYKNDYSEETEFEFRFPNTYENWILN